MNFHEQVEELKETISSIMVFAPDKFPMLDWLPPDGQVTLDSIFAELQSRFVSISNHRRIAHVRDKCSTGIENSYAAYKAGDSNSGFSQIQDVLHLLWHM